MPNPVEMARSRHYDFSDMSARQSISQSRRLFFHKAVAWALSLSFALLLLGFELHDHRGAAHVSGRCVYWEWVTEGHFAFTDVPTLRAAQQVFAPLQNPRERIAETMIPGQIRGRSPPVSCQSFVLHSNA
jgi:hypothetical protein